MRKFFRLPIVKEAVFVAILVVIGFAMEVVISSISPIVSKQIAQVGESMRDAIESLQITELGQQYLQIWGVYLGHDVRTKTYENCVKYYKQTMQIPNPRAVPTQCDLFVNTGPITGWIREHLTDYFMQRGMGALIGVGIAFTSIAAFVDLVWITFWQYGVVPRIMGLVELALGFAVALRIATWWTTDDNPKHSDGDPMALIRAGLFCVGVVVSACGVAAVTYGFGLLVASALSALGSSMEFVSEHKGLRELASQLENKGWTGGVIFITMFLLVHFFLKSIERRLEATIEHFFKRFLDKDK
jgi:hypothetical protein